MITKDISFVGTWTGNAEQLIVQFAKHKTFAGKLTDLVRAKRIAPFYIQYGQLFNLRADFAWSQMEHETGFLTFTGDVEPEQNNFAGIGATGGVPGNSFKTEELGITAHFAHLAWYYYETHINKFCNTIYDPRHFTLEGKIHYKYNGDISLGRLAGSWAVPGITYVSKLLIYIHEIENIFVQPDIPVTKFDIIIQEGHVPRTTGFTGTAGEQTYVKKIGEQLNHILLYEGLNVRLMGADNWLKPEPNLCIIFLALHCDGSFNPNAEGFSCGFKPGTNQRFKDMMAIKYKELTGFDRRADNYTENMTHYYSWREYSYKPTHVISDFYLLLEHGFLTNLVDKNWLNSHVTEVVNSHASTIIKFLKEVK